MALTKQRACTISFCRHGERVFVFGVMNMANEDYEDFDETAEPAEDEADEVETAAEEEEGETAAASDGEAPITRGDVDDAETLTVSSKEAIRRQLEEEMERFLAKGGKIQEIPPDETADPPKKPVSNYGSKPI